MSSLRKTGLILAIILGLADVVLPFVFGDTPEGQVGPPPIITYLGVALGVLTLAGVAWYWRRFNKGAMWLIGVTRTISALSGVPAFIFGAAASIQVLVAVFIVLTIICLVLLFRRQPAPQPPGRSSLPAAGDSRSHG